MLKSILAFSLTVFLGVTAAQSEPIRVLTSPALSPFTRDADDALPGFSVEIVMEIADRAGVEIVIENLPWKRAQNEAQKDGANVMIFGLTRNAAREPLYDWVSRIATVDWVFLTTGPVIHTVEEAAALKRVGARSVYKSYLEARGLTNIDDGEALGNMKKLAAGRIDAMATNAQRGQFMWSNDLGLDPGQLVIGDTFHKGDHWLGASPGFDTEIIRRMDKANADIHEDGTYARIYAKYFGNLPIPTPANPDQLPTGLGS